MEQCPSSEQSYNIYYDIKNLRWKSQSESRQSRNNSDKALRWTAIWQKIQFFSFLPLCISEGLQYWRFSLNLLWRIQRISSYSCHFNGNSVFQSFENALKLLTFKECYTERFMEYFERWTKILFETIHKLQFHIRWNYSDEINKIYSNCRPNIYALKISINLRETSHTSTPQNKIIHYKCTTELFYARYLNFIHKQFIFFVHKDFIKFIFKLTNFSKFR